MKLFLAAITVLLAVAVVYLMIAGNNPKVVKTEISIDAPPEKVWEILTDIDSWQEWNSTIISSTGNATLGADLNITMVSEHVGEDGPNYSPKIIQLDEPKVFHWRAHMMSSFIFTNEKIIELEATQSGTKLVHTETFKGMMAALMSSQLEQGVSPILNTMNESLKTLAEQP